MRETLKYFFTRKDNYVWFALTVVTLAYVFQSGALARWWFLVPLPIVWQSFKEWLIHKYLLHLPIAEKDGFWRSLAWKTHYAHHADPKAIDHVFAHLPATLVTGSLMYLGYALVLWSFERALVCMSVELVLFLFYEWNHLCHHTTYSPVTERGRKLKKLHLLHHLVNENYWWGITSGFADRVLGTWRDPATVPRSPTARNLEASMRREMQELGVGPR